MMALLWILASIGAAYALLRLVARVRANLKAYREVEAMEARNGITPAPGEDFGVRCKRALRADFDRRRRT